MAIFRHISTKMVLVLDAGTENGKKIRKRVTVSGIREDASTDALWELAQAMGKLLAYPVAEVRLYKVEAVEREEGDGAASEKGGVQKEADTDVARPAGGEGKNGLFSRSWDDGYLKEPRLSVCSLGNNRALRATSRMSIGSAAIPRRTQLGYTRPPPSCGQGTGQKRASFSSRNVLTAGCETAVAFTQPGSILDRRAARLVIAALACTVWPILPLLCETQLS